MLEMYDDIDWMDEPTETGWMPAPEQVSTYVHKYTNTTEIGWMPAPEQVST